MTAANLQKQSHKAGMDLQIRLQPEPAVFSSIIPFMTICPTC